MSAGPEERAEVGEGELATNLLEFDRKSFAFERLVEVGGASYALYARSETESESKFRPKVIRLWVAVPRRHLALDLEGDRLVAATDPSTPGPSSLGEAVEAAAEPSRFEERGIAWLRTPLSDGGYLYVPEADSGPFLGAGGLEALGLKSAGDRPASPSRNRGSG